MKKLQTHFLRNLTSPVQFRRMTTLCQPLNRSLLKTTVQKQKRLLLWNLALILRPGTKNKDRFQCRHKSPSSRRTSTSVFQPHLTTSNSCSYLTRTTFKASPGHRDSTIRSYSSQSPRRYGQTVKSSRTSPNKEFKFSSTNVNASKWA